ncbi:MAG: SDR family NAD(P)-dependent oxidoreductase, partial [Pseudomonadales bacterium]
MMDYSALQAGHAALITGGASGIGFAVAERLLKLGMKVCLVDKAEEELNLARQVLEVADPGMVITRIADVSSADPAMSHCNEFLRPMFTWLVDMTPR